MGKGARGQGMPGQLICLGEFVKANWQGDCPGDLQGESAKGKGHKGPRGSAKGPRESAKGSRGSAKGRRESLRALSA